MSGVNIGSRDWEVRAVVSLSAHYILGARAQMFEFRRKGETNTYSFFFIGAGAGMGAGAGGNVMAPGPVGMLKNTARTVSTAFHEVVRRGVGLPSRSEKELNLKDDWEEFTAFTPIKSESSFSPSDLDRSMGRQASAGASLALGYGAIIISAWDSDLRKSRIYFESQPVTMTGDLPASGTAGVNLNVSLDLGIWIRK